MDEWYKDFESDEVEEEEFCDRECYEFNKKLKAQFNDKCCEHCKKFMTLVCEHLEDFLDEIVDMEDYE